MFTIKKKRIEPGDLVEYRGRIYMAVSWDKTMPCATQCHLFNDYRCTGYCYRWEGDEDVVFRDIIDARATKATTVVVDCSEIDDYLKCYDDECKRLRKQAYRARAAAKKLLREKEGGDV